MGKYTVCVSTYVVVESDDLDSAYKVGEEVRSAVAYAAPPGFEFQVIDVELAGVYEVEDVDDEG